MKLNLTIPGGDPAYNSRAAELSARLGKAPEICYVTGTTAASGTTIVRHTLGRKPTWASFTFKETGNSWFVSDANALLWTTTQIAVTFAVASKNFTGRIEYLET